MSEVHDYLVELIYAKTGVRPRLNDTLDVMKIDSLAMAELTAEIENAMDIRIDEEVLDIENFQEFVSYVERKSARCPGQP
ncbi:MAG: acyl carrier protein [Planctomycetota bacterium]